MICDFNRYYITADYKAPYNDDKNPLFIGLSQGCMFKSFDDLLKARADWLKDKKLHNFKYHVILAGTLEEIEIIITEGTK